MRKRLNANAGQSAHTPALGPDADLLPREADGGPLSGPHYCRRHKADVSRYLTKGLPSRVSTGEQARTQRMTGGINWDKATIMSLSKWPGLDADGER
jgi:hypothetical protein